MSKAMLRKDLLAILVAMLLTEPAVAELQGVRTRDPTFTQAEIVIIGRNAALSQILNTDPWLVRKLLDAAASADQNHTGSPPSVADGPSHEDAVPVDPNENPDLPQLQRASPEAVHDLFQLLKQAGAAKQSSPK